MVNVLKAYTFLPRKKQQGQVFRPTNLEGKGSKTIRVGKWT